MWKYDSRWSVFAGLVGGILVVYSIEFIEKVLKIDDAVGAASAHGVVGAWGTLVIGLWGVDGDAGIGLLMVVEAHNLGTSYWCFSLWSLGSNHIIHCILCIKSDFRFKSF